jgi:hypothetical protein
MDGPRFCDDAACPSTHTQRELLLHCSELRLEPDQRDTLQCEFEDGSRVQAAWDDEGQTASCMLPQVHCCYSFTVAVQLKRPHMPS